MPQNQVPPPNEVIGGFQNALERGETLNQARQTFLNAGYSPREVQEAYVQMAQVNPLAAANPNRPVANLMKQPAAQQVTAAPKGKSNKKLYLITIGVAVLIIAASLFLGIFWGRLF